MSFKLHPWQEESVARSLSSPGVRWVYNDEMGLGKTAQGISGAARLGARRILCAVPASVRRQWVDKGFAKFWPERLGDVGLLFAGLKNKGLSKKKRAELELAQKAPIRIVSHNMLPQVVALREQWDCILIDEAHLFQHGTSAMSKAARQLVRDNPRTAVMAMTATCMPNKPADLFNLADIMCPGRFGMPGGVTQANPYGTKINHKFGLRYTNASFNGYGWQYQGVNEVFADELRDRLAAFSSRTTQQEVAEKYPDALPPLDIRLIEGDYGWDPIATSAQWAVDTLGEGNPHVCVLTHLRESAEKIAREVTTLLPPKELGGPEVICVTGAENPDERYAILERIKLLPSTVLVATMHSVARGIALTWYKRALLAELFWRPETIEQVLGRFVRLESSDGLAIVEVLVVPGTQSEVIALRLLDKAEALDKVTKEGRSAGKFRVAVDGLGGDSFLDGIRAAAASRMEGDYAVIEEDDEDGEGDSDILR